MPVPTRPSTCHPEKPAKTAKGECEACYRKRTRGEQGSVNRAIDAIDRLKANGLSLLELAAEAERILHEALPTAARHLVNAAEKAAARGDSRPAETILREIAVPTADGKGKRRILEPPARQYDHTSGAGGTGPQIIIGVQVGQLAGTAPLAEAPNSGSVIEPCTVQAPALPEAITVETVPVPVDANPADVVRP